MDEFEKLYPDIPLAPDELQSLVKSSDNLPKIAKPSRRNMSRDEFTVTEHNLKRFSTLTSGHKLKIAADHKAGMSYTQICVKHNISEKTLLNVLNDEIMQEVTSEPYINATKKLLSSRFYAIADMALNEIDPAKLRSMNPYQLGMLAAVALDKARLLEGQSTENISFRNLSVNIHSTLQQLQERKAELLAAIESKDAPAQLH